MSEVGPSTIALNVPARDEEVYAIIQDVVRNVQFANTYDSNSRKFPRPLREDEKIPHRCAAV